MASITLDNKKKKSLGFLVPDSLENAHYTLLKTSLADFYMFRTIDNNLLYDIDMTSSLCLSDIETSHMSTSRMYSTYAHVHLAANSA